MKYFKVSYRFLENGIQSDATAIHVYANEQRKNPTLIKDKIKQMRFKDLHTKMEVIIDSHVLISEEEYKTLLPDNGPKG